MKDKIAVAASFVPLIALMALGYIVPIASNIVLSLQNDSGVFIGLENYRSVLTSYYFLDSLFFTLKVSIIATFLSMVFAVIAALALRQTFVGKRLVVFMFQFNLTIPRMAAAMMLLLLLSQTGVISQLFCYLGIIDGASEFPFIVRDSGGLGLIIAFTWKFFPYIGMSVLGILQGASLEYENQAAVLGVGKFKRFWHVTLPLIIPATSIASIIVFAAAFGDYEIPTILGNSAHRMLSVFTYTKYSDSILMDKPEAYVLMLVMAVVLMAVILVYRKLTMPKDVK